MSDLKQLSAQFDFVCSTFISSLVDLTDKESNTRVHKDANHIKYIAGHLTNAMYGIASAVGVNLDRKWDDIFARGRRTKAQDNFDYPTIEEIKEEWESICPKIREAFRKLTNEDLEKELSGSFLAGTKIFDGSVGDYLAFFNQHQIYHIGQIGILRKMLGKGPMRMF